MGNSEFGQIGISLRESHIMGARAAGPRLATGHAVTLAGPMRPAGRIVQRIATHLAGNRAKRAMDVVLAATTLVLAMPILGLVALAVWVTMGRPIIFSQPRLGRHGTPFRCFKFRTMVTNAHEVLRLHLVNDAAAAQEWRDTCKLTRDPRVTPLGYLLRKSSLDELPQLVNILRGDMSCVGPRPIALGELERYGPHAREYLRMRPGLTGLWQTSGRSKLNYQDRVALDVHYANNRTLLLDISIILKTVPAVLKFDQSA